MQYQRPSSLAPSERSSIRRRSGGAALIITEKQGEHPVSRTCGCRSHLGQDVRFRWDATPEDLPTAILTRVSNASHSSLSFTEHLTDDIPAICTSNLEQWTNLALTSPVTQPAAADDDPSMSPNSAPSQPLSHRSLTRLTRGLSFFISTPAQLERTNTVYSNTPTYPTRPSLSTSHMQTFRTESSGSSDGPRLPYFLSRGTGIATGYDTRRQKLVSSLSTSSKFTQKWPKPLPMCSSEKRTSVRKRDRGLTQLTAELEEGSGLGMDRIERWNLAKWSLLVSLITVFSYGSAALLCAILTWFRSGSSLS